MDLCLYFPNNRRDEDVTTTLYAETSMMQDVEDKGSLVADKVNAVCEAMISHLKKDLSGMNIQNIITAYVCKSPPDLASAISLIATLKGKLKLCACDSVLNVSIRDRPV